MKEKKKRVQHSQKRMQKCTEWSRLLMICSNTSREYINSWTLSKKYQLHYNIYDTISFVNISVVNCTVQKFVHAKYKPWSRYTEQFKRTFYILYAQTFLNLKLCTPLMHSIYMAYIFNDRNSTFWHALIPGLGACTVPSSILIAPLSEKGQSTGMDV